MFPVGKLGGQALSVSGLLPKSGVWKTVLYAATPLVNKSMEHSLHEAASRLPTQIPGEAYLELESVKTVLTGSEMSEGERRRRQNSGNDCVHDGVSH